MFVFALIVIITNQIFVGMLLYLYAMELILKYCLILCEKSALSHKCETVHGVLPRYLNRVTKFRLGSRQFDFLLNSTAKSKWNAVKSLEFRSCFRTVQQCHCSSPNKTRFQLLPVIWSVGNQILSICGSDKEIPPKTFCNTIPPFYKPMFPSLFARLSVGS